MNAGYIDIALALIAKSGVREFEDPEVRAAIIAAANEFVDGIGITDMAMPDSILVKNGTAKTFKSSGGDSAITLASVANAAARQSVKLDLGTETSVGSGVFVRAELYAVKAAFEIAATPTAGNTIDLYWAPSSSATAGIDNPGNVSGADAAYTGYSANLTAAIKQLMLIGSFVCTTQATANVQKGFVGVFSPPSRWGSLVVVNNSGAALHSSDANMEVVMTPIEGVIAD
jgi:hypothetical protein